jgi:hypothetical protein
MTERKHSGWFNIDGDRIRSPLAVLGYVAACATENALFGAFGGGRVPRYRAAVALEPLVGKLDLDVTPCRAVSDLFWASLDWQILERAAGGAIHLADVGCGAGGYLAKLQDSSGGRIRGYRGFDIAESAEWPGVQRRFPFASFLKTDGEIAPADVPAQTSLIISQSALEHFVEDCSFMRLAGTIARRGNPLLQIHLVPSPMALKLYLNHGYRQYASLHIARLLDSFGVPADVRLVELGGRDISRLHFRQYVLPRLRRGRRPMSASDYRTALREALLRSGEARPGAPSFLALMIATSGARLDFLNLRSSNG